MSVSKQRGSLDQLPRPLPGPEAAARRTGNPIPPARDSENGQLRRAVKPTLIGLSAIAVSIGIPFLILVVLAFVAQVVINGR